MEPLYKDTPNKGISISNEDIACCPNHTVVYKSTSELGTPNSQLGPNGVLYREVLIFDVVLFD